MARIFLSSAPMNLSPVASLPPNALSKIFADARASLVQNDYPQAIQILRRAHAIDPANDRVLLELGRACAGSYDFAEAEKHFDKALTLTTAKTEVVLATGQNWMEVRNFEAAKDCFEKVLQQDHIPLRALITLTEIYIRQRRLEDAAAVAERGVKMDPFHPGALLSQAKVFRQMRKLEEAEKLLLSITTKPSEDAEVRAAAGYELGTVLDQQGRYDEAMKAFMDAKALLQASVPKVRAMTREKQRRLKEMSETVTESMVKRWRAFGLTSLQPPHRLALLGGHARSGTTLLEYVVDSHPEVISGDETSVFQSKSYFAISRHLSPNTLLTSVIDGMTARTIRSVRGEYFAGMESYFGQSIGDRFLMDKNPALTYDIPLFLRLFPEAKFLVALRDPRDVCLSCFMQPAPVLPDSAPWLTLEGTIHHYTLVMGLWNALKPCLGETAMEVRYEDMVENFEPTARRTLEFLGLPWDDRVLRFNEHAQKKTICSPTFAEVTKPIFKTAMGRWRNYQKYFDPHLEKLAPLFKSFSYDY